MTLSDLSIKNSVFAWMLMIGLILFGAICFRNLGVSQMPDVDFPVLTVQLNYEGAAPEIMETNVVDLVEDSLLSVEGIKNISSSSKQGEATITLEFELNRDINVALQEVQSKLSQVQRVLPKKVEAPIITKSNPDDFPIIWISLSANKEPREIMQYARDILKNQLQTVNGVSEILLSGYVEPNIRIWMDPDKMNQYELTAKDVVDALNRQHVEVPAGRIETDTQELNVRSMGEGITLTEIENIILDRRGGAPINRPLYLKDIAKVEKGLADVRRISRTDGKASIGLGLKKQKGSNSVAIVDRVEKKMEEIRKTLPAGYSIQVNFDTTTFIRNATGEMKHHLWMAALLTAVVCLFFLASWTSTFNILLAIPTSIVGAFTAFYFLGFTLNTFTLLGLTLAIGIVVDDAIMVLENIVRHQEMGKKPLQAAIDGAREISSAAIAATIAIVAVFAPVIFMQGIIGKFFFQFGVTLTVTVVLSLLEALTLTPMRCSKIRMSHQTGAFARAVDSVFSKMARLYGNILETCLKLRWLVLIASVAMFLFSLSVIPKLRKEFVPAQDQGNFIMRLKTPTGSSITYTDEKIKEVEKFVSNRPEVDHSFVAVGGFGGGDVNTANMFITLKDINKRPINPGTKKPWSQGELMTVFRKEISKFPNLEVTVQDLSMRGFTAQRGFPIEFSVRGPDWEKLADLSQIFIKKMKETPFFVDADTDYLFGQKEVQVFPIRSAAFARGVSIEDIGTTINTMIGGVRSGQVTEAGRRNDIRFRVIKEARQTKEDIQKLFVRNNRGELVSLSELVEIKEKATLSAITRKDRERAIGVFSNITPGQSQATAIQEIQKMAKELLPDGYRIVFSGSTQTFNESFNSLGFVLILGIVVAYMVLASQYNSFIHPIIVLLALPFSLSGAWVALDIFDLSLNIYSFIGVILLMGIAKKNSILLVDFTNQKREQGMPVREALIEACPQRLRPILMTSFATIAAAIPSALSKGAGSETYTPMAVVILGGVFVSTFLTLFVVPCAYQVMSRLELKKKSS